MTGVLTLEIVGGDVVMEGGGVRIVMTPHQALLLMRDLERLALLAMTAPPVAAGLPCAFCGGATQRAGTCFTCQSCGETTGCG